jgi:hypothetical protein
MLKIEISKENNFNEHKNTYFKVGMLKICRSMEVVLSKGEASFGGSSKTRGVLEKWGVRIDGE